ncbi:acyl-CoA thioesterase [Parabacteroides sp.]
MEKLTAELEFDIRFSEVDSMNVVWHGSYPLYFEDAREAFGRKYGLGYMFICDSGYYAPLVDLEFHYRKPIVYGMRPHIQITYYPTDSAKIIFDYVIRDTASGNLIATGRSIQVFMDKQYQLVLYNPPFYELWKQKWLSK